MGAVRRVGCSSGVSWAYSVPRGSDKVIMLHVRKTRLLVSAGFETPLLFIYSAHMGARHHVKPTVGDGEMQGST